MPVTQYSDVHSNRGNLLIHLFAVPLFIITVLALILALAQGRFLLAGLLVTGPLVSIGLQGFGHTLEARAPDPFKGPGDFLKRIFVEQFYIFPSYVLSGGWLRAWRSAGRAVD